MTIAPVTKSLHVGCEVERAFRAFTTEVEVRFTPDGDGTRVDLEHRNWERGRGRSCDA